MVDGEETLSGTRSPHQSSINWKHINSRRLECILPTFFILFYSIFCCLPACSLIEYDVNFLFWISFKYVCVLRSYYNVWICISNQNPIYSYLQPFRRLDPMHYSLTKRLCLTKKQIQAFFFSIVYIQFTDGSKRHQFTVGKSFSDCKKRSSMGEYITY